MTRIVTLAHRYKRPPIALARPAVVGKRGTTESPHDRISHVDLRGGEAHRSGGASDAQSGRVIFATLVRKAGAPRRRPRLARALAAALASGNEAETKHAGTEQSQRSWFWGANAVIGAQLGSGSFCCDQYLLCERKWTAETNILRE